MKLERLEGTNLTLNEGGVDLGTSRVKDMLAFTSEFLVTHGLGVRSEGAHHKLGDEGSVRVDLAVTERDPLVNEGSLLGVGA